MIIGAINVEMSQSMLIRNLYQINVLLKMKNETIENIPYYYGNNTLYAWKTFHSFNKIYLTTRESVPYYWYDTNCPKHPGSIRQSRQY